MILQEELNAQYDALIHGCGIVPIERTVIEARGKDRASFLHNFCTNDIKRLQTGEGCEAFVTNVQGKTIGHGFFLANDDVIVISSVGGQGEFLFSHLDRYLITEDVQFHDISAETRTFVIAGQASGLLAERLGISLPEAPYRHTRMTLDNVDVSACRVDMTESPSLLLAVDASDAEPLWKMFVEAGVTPCGERVFTVARVEHRFPYFGIDITNDNLPQEVDRNAAAISFTKGCYLGQETVARLDALGHVNRLLRKVSLQLQEKGSPPESLQKIIVNGKVVGSLGTIVHAIDGETMLALAYLRVQYTDTGTELNTEFGTLTVL